MSSDPFRDARDVEWCRAWVAVHEVVCPVCGAAVHDPCRVIRRGDRHAYNPPDEYGTAWDAHRERYALADSGLDAPVAPVLPFRRREPRAEPVEPGGQLALPLADARRSSDRSGA